MKSVFLKSPRQKKKREKFPNLDQELRKIKK